MQPHGFQQEMKAILWKALINAVNILITKMSKENVIGDDYNIVDPE